MHQTITSISWSQTKELGNVALVLIAQGIPLVIVMSTRTSEFTPGHYARTPRHEPI